MKCIKYLFSIGILFLIVGSNELLAQDCFDPNDPVYNSQACVKLRECYDINSTAYGTPDCVLRTTEDVLGTTPINCNDGIDNDRDGNADCADSKCPDCSSVPEICNDGIDNDGDGDVDCADSDCSGNPTYCESDCGNGVDDDGDGFYDYYDGDCLADPDNPNDYIVNQPDCEAEPLGNVFDITEAWSSPVRTASARGLPAVADIDNDGVPEVISFNDHTRTMHILNGQDGTVERSKTYNKGPSTWSFTYPAVGDVDGDDFGEIFHVDKSGKLWAWNHDLTRLWDSDFKKFSVFSGKNGRVPGIADFNLDGVPEVFYVNEIRNAQTGALIVKGSHGQSIPGYTAHNWQTELSGVPVAIDILPDSECTECSGLELVLGHIIYAVDIPGGRLVEVKNMNDEPTKIGYTGDYFPKDPSFYGGFDNQTFNTTAVADYDSDGFLDVVCSGATINEGGPGTVFFWNVAKQEVRAFTASVSACDIKARDDSNAKNIIGSFKDITTTPDRNNNGVNSCDCNTNEDCTWIRGIGSLNLANIDADPELECTFMSGSSLFALDNDWSLKWVNNDDYWESSSGVTGTAVFDFDGDGASEIIYRDEVHLWIVDGFTGQQLNTYDNVNFCSSMTHAEYPIVADVDSDGETELVVVCARDQNFYGQGPNTGGNNNQYGFIRTYKAANGNYWVPARSVWNQFSYFNVNINDDLSIPRIPQPHHLSFSQICNDPTISAPFSLNKFLNQSPRLSYCGTLVFPAPKLDFVGDSTQIIPPSCPEQDFQIRLYFENNGDEEVEKPIPISFYSENPRLPYTDTEEDPHFSVINIDIVGGLQPGDFVDTTLTVTGPRGAYTVFASLNDIGPYDSLNNKIPNSTFYPLSKINGPIRECDDTPTIVSIEVNPPPFQAVAEKLRDNRNCPGDVSNVNTGEVQVLSADSTVLQESEYDITWTNIRTGDVVGNTAMVTGLDSGTYVVDINYDNGIYFCQGIADTVRVERFEDWPDGELVALEVIQSVSSCIPGTADGQARVLINGNSPNDTDYLIEWEDEQQAGVLALGDTAINLQPILYKVTVTNLLTGCSETETIDMTLDLPEIDAVNTTDNTNCKNPNGTITVQMVGSVGLYDYMLIQMSPLQDTVFSNNPSFNGLDEGIYEVRAYDPTNDCGLYTSGEQVEIITTKSINDISIEVAQQQTACSFPYNGQLTAVVANPNKYDWTWYRGTVTSGAFAEVVATNFVTPDTLSTNLTDIYTVVAVDNSSGCSFSESIVLTENVIIPTIDATDISIIQHQTTCEPNGQVQISVGGATNGYQFTLLQGSTTIEANFTGLFTGLEAGPYVVIAEDTATNCISDASSIFQIENRIAPFGTIAIAQTPKTNCDAANPNGAIGITVGGVTAGYTFKWFVGVDTASAVSPQPSSPGQLTGIDAGNYVISIVSQSSGCDTIVYTSVIDQSADYRETITATKIDDQRYCTTGVFSGAIEADLIASVSGGTPDTANYTYYWYSGTKNNVRNGSASLISGENRSTIHGLDVGWYSVRAIKNDGTGCAALDTAQIYIDDLRDFPVAGINVSVIEQSSCDANNQNGGLRGDVNGNTSGYVFTWYQLIGGVDTPITNNNPNAVVNGFSVDNIGVGSYIVEVENTETGCTGREQVYLGDNIIKGTEIRLNLSATAATLCSPPNGVAEVTSIELSEDDGVTFTLNDILSNYNYQWYFGEDATTEVSSNPTATTSRLENVEPGMYTVVATNINSICASVAYTVEVESQIQNNLDFTFTPTTQSDCVNPDGALTATGISGSSGPFNYQWYKGGDDTYPLFGETTNTLTNIRSDKYMLRITDIGSGCYKDSVYVLEPDTDITPVPPAVLSIPPTPARTCNPSDYATLGGEIEAEVEGSVRTNFFPGHNDSDFYYYWFEGENVKYLDPSASPIDDIGNFDIMTAAPTSANNQSTVSGLAPGFYTVIVVDAYDFNNSGGALGCRSDPRTFEVVAESQSPLVVTTVEQDSLCLGNSGKVEAIIEKRATDGTAFSGFTLTGATQNENSFFPLPGAVTYSEVDVAGTQTEIEIDLLEAGNYTFTFQDETTSCDTTITIEITDASVNPVLAYDNIRVNNHQTSCNPVNGELEVITSITNGITNLPNYSYYWHGDTVTISSDINNASASTYLGTGSMLSGLDSGLYYVYAIDNTTGCTSGILTGEILYQVSETQIAIVQNTSNVDCSGAAQGSITVEAFEQNGSGPLITPAGSYDFFWFDESSNAVASTEVGNQSTISNLSDGAYRVEVRNNNLDCETVIARDTIVFDPMLPEFTAASVRKQNVTTCNGDGRIEITEVMEDGALIQSTDAAFADYNFQWYQGSPSGSPLPETTNILSNLTVDTYYVYVTNTSTGGCQSSDFLTVVLSDSIETPFIYLNSTVDFISCTGVNEGSISVTAEEWDSSVPAVGYTYSWRMADGTALPASAVGGNTSVLSNVSAGSYEVTALNSETGCSQTAVFDIDTQTAVPLLTMNKTADQSNCFPSNGAAEVASLTFRGIASPYTDFQFVWSEDDFNTIIGSSTYGLDANGLAADSLATGRYLVKAVNLTTGCESLPVQVDIIDSTENLVVILDNISDPIVACDPSDNAEGSVEVEVINNDNYITRWYQGAVIIDPTDSLTGFSNSLEAENLVPGVYTVWVQDTLTGCETTRSYTIEGVAVPLLVSTSTMPFTNCISPNGQVAANATGGSGSYSYEWIDSDGNVLPTNSNQNIITGLNDGNYTVQVSDRTEPDCAIAEAESTVPDSRGNVVPLSVVNDFSVTNCDITRPNGQLSVRVEGEMSRYEFFWYVGDIVQGNPIAQGPTAGDLAPDTYSVVARDKVTGCISEPVNAQVNTEMEDFMLPTPTAILLSPVTRCENPDGSVQAVLDSTLLDGTEVFEYLWYDEDGEEVFRSTKTNEARELAAGEYFVSITNTVTGCYSESTSITVPEEIRIPEFEIATTPSTCFEPTGSAQIRFNENFKVVNIEWLTPEGYTSKFFLNDQMPGLYEVTVTDDKGCSFTKSATIESTIYTYNGISPNGDGENDKFIISCIEDFEENIVRIYNRAGALVYENEQYDNLSSYFEGLGNRGLYIGGEKLPDGTYFYIIDKNNGDDPESGYLELMR